MWVSCAVAGLHRVHHQNGDVAPVNGADGANHAVLLNARPNLAAPAYAGGVYEQNVLAVEPNHRVYGVAGGAGDFADDGAVLAGERVQQHGLAHVGPADYRQPNVGVRLRELGGVGEVCDDVRHHVVEPQIVVSAYGMRIAETELVELRRAGRLVFGIHLVDGENDGLAAAPEQVGDVGVGRRDALGDVRRHDDDVGVFHRGLDLRAHLPPEVGIRKNLQPAGVDEDEVMIRP